MARSTQVDTALLGQYPGATCELDSRTGLYNPGMQYLASGVLEWIRALFWSHGTDWDTILAQAAAIPNGADGVTMNTQLLDSPLAGWQGVTLTTTPAHFTAQPRKDSRCICKKNARRWRRSRNLRRVNSCWWGR